MKYVLQQSAVDQWYTNIRVYQKPKSKEDREQQNNVHLAPAVDVNESVDCCKFTPQLLLSLKIFNICLKQYSILDLKIFSPWKDSILASTNILSLKSANYQHWIKTILLQLISCPKLFQNYTCVQLKCHWKYNWSEAEDENYLSVD